MSNQDILTKAIEKALEGGWQYNGNLPINWHNATRTGEFIQVGHDDGTYPELSVNDLIFNHDFAKALWGDGGGNSKHHNIKHWEVGAKEWHDILMPDWKWHLQQMVITEDPIAYLAESLENYNKSDSAKGVL